MRRDPGLSSLWSISIERSMAMAGWLERPDVRRNT
jgi:hypothetical protein